MTAGGAGLAPIVASACEKAAYRSRIWAERAVTEHLHDAGPCRQCRRGYRMTAYHCDAGHWHTGHPQRRGAHGLD